MAPNMQLAAVVPEFLFWSPALFGWLWTGIALAIMLGNSPVPWLMKIFSGERWVFVIAFVLIGEGIVVAPWMSSIVGALIFFLVHEMGRGVFGPSFDAYLNRVASHSLFALIYGCTRRSGIRLIVKRMACKDLFYSVNLDSFSNPIVSTYPYCSKIKGQRGKPKSSFIRIRRAFYYVL